MTSSRSNARKKIRVYGICEDMRTKSFLMKVLVGLGFHKRKIDIQAAPSGEGAADKWVTEQFREEARIHRSKRSQTSRRLLAIVDGDDKGAAARKQQLDHSLSSSGQPPRGADEKIAIAIPTWSIETWLLALLEEPDIVETAKLKDAFERRRSPESRDIRDAAAAWRGDVGSHLPSLVDGREEFHRLDP